MPTTNPYHSPIVDEFMKKAREAIGDVDVTLKREKEEEKLPEFIDTEASEEMLSNIHSPIILYSEKFKDAKAYLASSGLEDFDISTIIHKPEDWDESDREFIPDVNEQYVWQHEVLYPAVRALVSNLKVLVVGPTGSGKTEMYRNIAAICNQPYLRIGGRGDMESDTIFGKMVIRPDGSMEFVKADFPRAFEKGWLIALDEPWKLPSNITMAWQRVFERGGILQLDDIPGELKDKQIHAEKRTRMVLCDNVIGTGDDADRYAATMIQDSSTLNRIDLVLRLGYLTPKSEIQMITSSMPYIPNHIASKAVQLCNLIRDAYEKYQISVTMSPRNLTAWLETAYAVRSYPLAFKWVMLERYSEQAEKEAVKGFWATVFGTSL